MSTLKELCERALQVQDACNLSGVVNGFARDLGELRKLYPKMGTDGLNRHPVSILWSSKIASLTGSGTFSEFERAWEFCSNVRPENEP